MSIDIDKLANEIRRVDGGHKLGAGALAELLAPFIDRELEACRADAERYAKLRSFLQVTRNKAVPDCISLDHIRVEGIDAEDDKDYIDAYLDSRKYEATP